ncbi:MAG: hypothetical protein ACYTG0_43535 [Planctomycetota bacterium]|jgi:hypothetical protein
MAEPRIKWNGKQVLKEVQVEVVKRMHQATAHLETATRRNLNKGKSRVSGGSAPGKFPHADTGTLRDSIFRRVDVSGDVVTGDVGTKLQYGLALELGATIRPKKAKALAVPVSKEAKRHGFGPRSFPKELTMVPREGKPPLLVEEGKRMFKIHYVLLKVVHLKARPFLRPTLNMEKPKLAKIFAKGGVGMLEI